MRVRFTKRSRKATSEVKRGQSKVVARATASSRGRGRNTSPCPHRSPLPARALTTDTHALYKARATSAASTTARGRARSPVSRSPGAPLFLFSFFSLTFVRLSVRYGTLAGAGCWPVDANAAAAMPRCLMAKKWKVAPAAEVGDESDEEIDVVGEGRGQSPAPAATAPGPSPRDPEPTLLYNGTLILTLL